MHWRSATASSAVTLAALIHLATNPPLFWDEGWTLALARNWVETGHYGQILQGHPAPPGLAAAFPVVLPIAASFRLLGVGTWQGRLPGALVTLGALLLLWWLSASLFGRAASRATLAAALLVPFPSLHPILLGKQAFAEMPMLFYLLAGYAALLRSAGRSRWWLVGAAILWGLALTTKLQALPFLAVSVAAAAVDALLRRRWRLAVSLACVLTAAGLLSRVLGAVATAAAPVTGLYSVVALVPFSTVARLRALIVVVVAGVPTVVALAHWARQLLVVPEQERERPERRAVTVALYALVVAWAAWFALFSIGWERYFFPPMLIGTLFVGAWVADLGIPQALAAWSRRQSGKTLRPRDVLAAGMGVGLLPFALTGLLVPSPTGGSAQRIAAYLDSATPPGAVIETYETELLFLVHRSCHYPPDQTHVDLNRRTFLHQPVPIRYSLQGINPDYVVIGPQAHLWSLYEDEIRSGFRAVRQDGPYTVYQRDTGSRR